MERFGLVILQRHEKYTSFALDPRVLHTIVYSTSSLTPSLHILSTNWQCKPNVHVTPRESHRRACNCNLFQVRRVQELRFARGGVYSRVIVWSVDLSEQSCAMTVSTTTVTKLTTTQSLDQGDPLPNNNSIHRQIISPCLLRPNCSLSQMSQVSYQAPF